MSHRAHLLRPAWLVGYALPDIAALNRASVNAVQPTGLKAHELLLKELDERNKYARKLLRGYVTWFAFFVLLNLGGLVLFLTQADRFPASWQVAAAMLFIFADILSILWAYTIARADNSQEERMEKIINALSASYGSAPKYEMLSPYPPRLFKYILIMLALAFVGVAAAWFVMLVVWLSAAR